MKRKLGFAAPNAQQPFKTPKLSHFLASAFSFIGNMQSLSAETTIKEESFPSALAILPREVFPVAIGEFISAYSFVGENTILQVSKQWHKFFSEEQWNKKKNRAAVLSSAYGSYSNPISDDPLIFLSDQSLYQQFSIYALFRIASKHVTLAKTLFNTLKLPFSLYKILGQTHREVATLILQKFIPANALNLSHQESSKLISTNEDENESYFTLGMHLFPNVSHLLKILSEVNIEIALFILENAEYKALLTFDDLLYIFSSHPQLYKLFLFKNENDAEAIVEKKNQYILNYLTKSAEKNDNVLTWKSIGWVMNLANRDISFAQWVLENPQCRALVTRPFLVTIICEHAALLDKYLSEKHLDDLALTTYETQMFEAYQAILNNILPKEVNFFILNQWYHFLCKSPALTEKFLHNETLSKRLDENILLGIAMSHNNFNEIERLFNQIVLTNPIKDREEKLKKLALFLDKIRDFINCNHAIQLMLSNNTIVENMPVETLQKVGASSILYFTDYIIKHKLIESKFKTHTKLSAITSAIKETTGVDVGFQKSNERTALEWTAPLQLTLSYAKTISETANAIRTLSNPILENRL